MTILETLTRKQALIGGTSLAVIALAVVATQHVTESPRVLTGLLEQQRAEDGRSVDAASAPPEPLARAELRNDGDAGGRAATPTGPMPTEPTAPTAQTLADRQSAQGSAAGAGAEADAPRRERLALPPGRAKTEALAGRTLAPTPTPAPAPAPAAEAFSADAVRGLAASPAVEAEADIVAPQYREQGRDRFEAFEENAVKRVAEEPVSTFSIDVDTASYALVRRALMEGVLPPRDAVRVEEMINYFAYDYPAPDSLDTPFRADVAIVPTPWNAGTELVRIGLQGYALPAEERPRANLVFLLDTSGSMNSPDKLPLLVNAFRMLVETLGPEDRVSIVTYAGSAGTVLEPTPASEKGRILAALERLSAGGSTAGGEGIRQAYALAEANFDEDGVNRVFLATDGDFNVGIRDTAELEGFVERKRESGVLLSVLGFGRGNLNDQMMQALAQAGNGQALYIDTLAEAQKALVEEAGGSLFPIAKDVKIQVEFNPAAVSEYRLIGYETRALAREDFNNDRVDAGEIGSGHRVTALYEITPTGSGAERIEPLRYQSERTAVAPLATEPEEIAFLKIRHKAPEGGASRLTTRPITPEDRRADREADWAAAVAAFGQLLRGGRYTGTFSHVDVIALAERAKGPDPYGYRAEFLRLVRLAKSAAALEPQRR